MRVVDPCPGALSIDAPEQKETGEYRYDPIWFQFKFKMVSFVTEPSNNCSVLYSCLMLDGPIDLDLCALPEDDDSEAHLSEKSEIEFDPQLGNYRFFSLNMERFPPGTYTFQITG